ncbi:MULTISPECIES: hypothetical protein [Fischerella]|uniref:Uncharacterized protein n=1 Tax=Fischerella muscicola CCMEE 5323 TaxID=2019572 RepID=A0A2N6K5N2_FISMU|nr:MULTISPECIES: hypothetical protein [Fischerella]MBD2432090.1 hypothetical protein [Fischerella sp. FACHB-380]PLZ91884.1 hypothetical protein CEN44_07455 [Fischerella muscicola CCMEE 5323]
MLKRLILWLKRFFQRLLGNQKAPTTFAGNHPKEPPPPLTDTDLEFLFTELLEGVHQARGQQWALKWLHNIEHRVPTERWIEWLHGFGEKLLASPTPNNELAARMIQLGELEVGEVGDVAHDIGMQLLTRNQGEPVWEYEGPDAQIATFGSAEDTDVENFPSSQVFQAPDDSGNLPEGEFQTVTLDELLVIMQQDENLRQMIAQQLGVDTEDPQMIIQALIDQFHAANQSNTEQR